MREQTYCGDLNTELFYVCIIEPVWYLKVLDAIFSIGKLDVFSPVFRSHSEFEPFGILTIFDHLNTGHIRCSDRMSPSWKPDLFELSFAQTQLCSNLGNPNFGCAHSIITVGILIPDVSCFQMAKNSPDFYFDEKTTDRVVQPWWLGSLRCQFFYSVNSAPSANYGSN